MFIIWGDRLMTKGVTMRSSFDFYIKVDKNKKVFTHSESQYIPQTNLVRALVLAIGKYDTKYDSQCGSQM